MCIFVFSIIIHGNTLKHLESPRTKPRLSTAWSEAHNIELCSEPY